MKIKEKTFVVTGGGNGLGRELVLGLLKRGSNVVAVDVNMKALLETKGLAGNYSGNLMISETDITNKEAITGLPAKISTRFRTVDGLINNAGIIQPFRKIVDMDNNSIERVFRINFFGTLDIIKVFIPYLQKRPEAHIVNVSSMGGFLPVAGQAIYGASKAAVKILSEALTSELTGTGINVTTVVPGAMYTNIKKNSGLGTDAGAGPEGHSANAAFSPGKAARMIIDAVENRKQWLYIGKDAKSMNVLYRLNPAMATKMIYRKINHKM